MKTYKFSAFIIAIISFFILPACAPEIGSAAWCEKMDSIEKGDWSVNDATEYMKSCIIKTKE